MASSILYCSLEVDVNGEETCLVDKELLCAYSSKLRKLFGRSKPASSQSKTLKLFFNDFPGGAKSFELLARFCYSNGNINLSPSNICLLHSAARYLEMDKSVAGAENLLQQTEKCIKEISYWSWSELLGALNQCQETLKLETSSCLLEKCVESLVARLASARESSSCPSSSSFSSDSFGARFSCDTPKSLESLKNSLFRVAWWFEDLAFLSLEMLQIVVKFMVCQKLDNHIISRFLLFYHKSRLAAFTFDEKRKVISTVIDLLYLLDWTVIPFKSLMGLLQVASSSNVGKFHRTKLESMTGSQLDQAKLDSLLIQAPNSANYLYDVNLVLRLLKAFVHGEYRHSSLDRLKNVARLMDMYLSEVAPDPALKPSKFVELATALPDRARESCDGIYRAIDLYQQVHTRLSEEDRLKICSALNFSKLSPEACAHIAQKATFPSRPVAGVLVSQRFKLNSVISLNDYPRKLTPHVIKSIARSSEKKGTGHCNVSSDNWTLKEDMKGSQWRRVMELEKLDKKIPSPFGKTMKSKSASQSGLRSLPKLCN